MVTIPTIAYDQNQNQILVSVISVRFLSDFGFGFKIWFLWYVASETKEKKKSSAELLFVSERGAPRASFAVAPHCRRLQRGLLPPARAHARVHLLLTSDPSIWPFSSRVCSGQSTPSENSGLP